ncbi:hypothetical protein [Streptomyces hiroshimensis]|uniref:Alpha/beta hydrolase n=1 Tax=Streptomyces hiroshimensis TaxID=66424 RepID=A0ABQ2Z794_9ACTN|nr:hypothetical protein [Streptomyces hiroshimensis]GGY05753.1 hypothetical protein GCM10010324_60740 [Streptomyces hiroshimensis]
MAIFVGVHGIGQQYRGKYSLSEAWRSALKDGLSEAGHDAEAEQVKPGDVRVMFFGGLFRPRTGAMAAEDPPYSAADIQAGPEKDFLETLYGAAVKQDPSSGPGEGAMFSGSVPVQAMLTHLLSMPLFGGIAQRAFIGNLKQVTRYLADESLKGQVLDRVHDGIGDDTRVIIGHSLGSVVAYEYMCQFRPASVRLLLTLGSPPGIPRLVFDRLTPCPENGKGAWAGSVPTWVNVADINDIVAMRKKLAGLFPGPNSETVDDRLVDNGGDAHSIERYLNAPQTGSALHEAIS